MKLEKSEQETHVNQSATNRDEWVIYTDDPVRIKEFKSKNYPFVPKGFGVEFTIPDALVTFRTNKKQTRKLSFEEKQKRSERMKKMCLDKMKVTS